MEENNYIIAEFMGRKFSARLGSSSYGKEFDTYAECEQFIKEHKLNGYTPQVGWKLGCGLYHKSWDWLMPVFEKIQQLEPGVPGLYTVRTARMGRGTAYIEIHTTNEGWETKSHTFHASSEITINALYEVCVDFIKYYNAINPLPCASV